MIVDRDSPHTLLEVWPAAARAEVGNSHVFADDGARLPERWPHHAYISVARDTETIVAALEREGWAFEVAHNGPPGGPGFDLVRAWIENQTCIELASPEHLQQYVDFCRGFARAQAERAAAARGGA